MSNFLDSLQVELIFSLIIMVVMAIFFIYAGKKFATADPTARPKGVVLVVETGVKMIYDYLTSIMPKKFEKSYYPYFAMLFAYLIIANLSGLLGFEAPTSNYSITLALTTITFCLIQFNAIKKQGLLSYIWGAVWPPTNLLSILSGSILMYLVYQLTGYISGLLINFNFLGPVIAPWLHCYFDVFAGCIQTLVFVTLSSILIMMENPD